MQQFDVVVVGGGPAGAVAARTAAAGGASVLLLEQRPCIDGPSACAGLVSPRTLLVLGASDDCVLRRLRRATFHAPGGGTLSVEATSDRALVIDRSVLERELLARAVESGVDVRLGAKATGWRDRVLRIDSSDGEDAVRCGVLVGADGPESQVAAWVGLPAAPRGLRAAQAEVALPAGASDEIHVFVGERVAPGFFAWAIPAQEDRLRVGLAASPGLDPAPYLQTLLAERFAGHRIVSRLEDVIPFPPAGPIVADHVLLVGDAAAHVKPLSGGGLYFGGLCARAAGRAAARAAAGDSLALRRYEATCLRLIGAETRFGIAARSIRESLRDDQWDRILAILADRDVLALAADRLDLDHLRYMVGHMIGHPVAWRALLRVVDVLRSRADDRLGVAQSHDGLL